MTWEHVRLRYATTRGDSCLLNGDRSIKRLRRNHRAISRSQSSGGRGRLGRKENLCCCRRHHKSSLQNWRIYLRSSQSTHRLGIDPRRNPEHRWSPGQGGNTAGQGKNRTLRGRRNPVRTNVAREGEELWRRGSGIVVWL